MLWVRILGYVVICSFFVSFSCLTALQEITSQSFMEILNKDLRRIMIKFSYLDMMKRKANQGQHIGEEEKKKMTCISETKNLNIPIE